LSELLVDRVLCLFVPIYEITEYRQAFVLMLGLEFGSKKARGLTCKS